MALIGNNGTGKTTILKIINDLIPADGGSSTTWLAMYISVTTIRNIMLLHMEKTIFEEIADDYPHLTNTKIRNVLAAFLIYRMMMYLSGSET